MDPAWLLLLLPLAAASGWLASNSFSLPWRKRNRIPSIYLQGINYLLNEQHDKATEIFLDMLEVDSETIEIHLTLGNLYRRRGEIERATLIHENLIDRSDVPSEQKKQAIFELGHDFYSAGILDRAERIFTELTDDENFEEPAYEALRDIYEQEKEWDNCLKVTSQLNKHSSKDYSHLIAQYHCEKAEEAIREGRYDNAEENIKEALSYDKNCVRAVLQSGRVKAIRGEHELAISIWRSIEQKNPKYVLETVDLVSESYRAINQIAELAEFLRTTAEATSDTDLAVAYVDALEVQDKELQAGDYLIDWIRNHPSLHALHRLVLLKIKGAKGKPQSRDFQLIDMLIRGEMETSRSYACERCGYTVKTLHWQCPGCRGWNTITTVRPAMLSSMRRKHSDTPA